MPIGEIYGKLDFPVLLILGETFIARFFPKRSYYPLRLALVFLVTCTLNILTYFIWNSEVPFIVFLRSISAFLLFLITLVGLPFCYKASFPSCLLAGTIGYCLQNSSYCLMSTIRIQLPIDATENWYYLLLMLVPIFLIECLTIDRLYLHDPKYRKGIDKIKEKRQIFITFFTIAALSLISSYGMKYSAKYDSDEFMVITYLFNIAVGAISMTSELEMILSHQTTKEATRIKTLYEKDKENFKQASENIDMVNIRMHDMRHRLDALDSRIGKEELDEIKNSMAVYEQIATTNCPAFDLVLKEKSVILTSNKIRFTCFLDAAKLNYISKGSLYSIFENALSNAIEAVKKLPEEKRVISITGNDFGDYLTVHIENYCLVDTNTQEGKTTDPDKIHHGFGLKSMNITMNENHGRMSVTKKGDLFALDLLFLTTKPNED